MLSLSRLFARELGTGGAARAGRIYPWILALGVAGLAFAARGADGVPAPGAIVSGAVSAMSWAALLVAGAIAGEARTAVSPLGFVRGLSRARAISRSEERAALLLAGVRTVVVALGLPSLVLALVVVVCAGRAAGTGSSIRIFAGVAVHAVAFGLVFGGLAAFLRLAWPRRGRLVFGVVVTVLLVTRATADDLSGGPLGCERLISVASHDAPRGPTAS